MPDLKGRAKYQARKRRERRTRAKLHGTQERPRLTVYRSLDNIFAQVIDDDKGHTIASASTIDKDIAPQVDGKKKTEAARLVGEIVGARAKEAGVETVVFDRSGYRYHGRVQALADGAREAGLKF